MSDRDFLACLAWLALWLLAQLLRHLRATELASPGELEGPAGGTRTDYLARGSERAKPCLVAHQTPLPVVLCSAQPLDQSSSPKHRHSVSLSLPASRRKVKLSLALLSHWSHDTIKTLDQTRSPCLNGNLLGRSCGVGWVVKDVQTRPLVGVLQLISRT